ncbi:MAG: hypothetical protein SFX73_14995 [Kofleriaceae bacterium]|nr:hypothetical protein [Kofleriaceae bacterium]
MLLGLLPAISACGSPQPGGADARDVDAAVSDGATADSGDGGDGGGGASTLFDPLYTPGFMLDDERTAVTQTTLPNPQKSTTGVLDPTFGVYVRRITANADVADTVSALGHEYSRRQAYNADSTRFIAQASNGFWYLYDAVSLQRLDGGRTQSPGTGAIVGLAGDCEPIWHPSDPNKLWHTSTNGGLVWSERDVVANTTTQLFDLTAHVQALGWTTAARAWWKGEGRPSDDGRWWALMVETSAFQPLGIIMYDRMTDTIVGHQALTGNRPDHLSTSPLGNYAVVSWYGNAAASLAEEAARPLSTAGGVRAYSRDFSTFRVMSVLGEHSDLALDAAGNEVFVAVSFHGAADGVTDGRVFFRRLDDGTAYDTPINTFGGSTGTGIHVSGTATARRGWVVVSKYAGVGSGPFDGQVVAVELVPSNARVLRLAHHRSSANGYFFEPHASVNRDFTRVMFSSDWSGAQATALDYEIMLPSWAIPP